MTVLVEELATVPPSNNDSLIHFYCEEGACTEDVALCGEDISTMRVVDEDDEGPICVVCDDLAEVHDELYHE